MTATDAPTVQPEAVGLEATGDSVQCLARRCRYFPETTECDKICAAIGCGAEGLVIHMRSQGIPESELGESPDPIFPTVSSSTK